MGLKKTRHSGQERMTRGASCARRCQGRWMAEFPKKITDDPYGASILIRRLVMEQGAIYWRRYLYACALMGIAAGATSLSAYLLGRAINEAYVDKNIPGIALFSGIIFLLFLVRGVAIHAQTV